MAPKKKKTSSTRGRGKGKKTPSSSSSKPADPPVDIPDPSADDEPDVPERSRSPTPPRERSRESSVSSSVSIAVSTSSRLADDKGKKRAKKNPCNLSNADEELMLEFIRENPVLWNVKMTDYRRKDKKEKIWEDQAQLMEKTADTLKGWFRSLRDTHTRLDKKKSGDGAPYLTEREEWIISKFVFLNTVIRHRPEPLQSVKATIQQHRGDLDAAETACADLEIGLDELTPTPSSTPSSSRKRPQDLDIALLESLQKRVAEAGTIIEDLSKAQQQPITTRTAFANYVKDSLLTMSNANYKKARSTINRLLSDLMDEDSDDDIPSAMGAPPIPATQQVSHSQPPHPLRPSSAPSFGLFGSSAPSTSEQYQPPPHMWRNVPPASSVWGSQSMEYMEQ